MNREAERHLVKAEGFLAKGDGWYEKAADEIIAAFDADPKLSQTEVGKRFGRSQKWVWELVRWRTSDEPGNSPAWQRGSHATAAEIRKGAEKLLKDAPLEQVEQIISELPRNRQRAIGAAAGHAYLGARQDYEEAENRMTERERKEREATRQAVGRTAASAAAGFATLGIVGHIEQATEELRELIADSSVSKQMAREIDRVTQELVIEVEVAKGVAGLEGRIA